VWQNGVADEAADADRKRHRSAGSWSGELGMYTREEQALMAKVRGTIADPQRFLELEGAYDVHELVGDGTFSRVFKAVCRATRQDVAVKRVYQTVHPDTILNEARYLQRLGGTCNVPKLLNVRYEPHSIATHTCTRTRARAHTHTHNVYHMFIDPELVHEFWWFQEG
jgi:serine/threonine protein kinase